MFRPSIFCAVDFSDASRGALRYAAAIAEHFFVNLTVATVDDPLLSEASTIAFDTGALTARTRQELEQFVAATFAGRALMVPEVQYVVATGKPATEIRRLASAEDADLIVMSSHGRTGVGKLFFGSTTERVLRETEIPVLVTPATDPGPATLEAIRTVTRAVLAPVDLTVASRRQLQIASGLAVALGARLLLLHVLEPWPTIGDRDVLARADAARRARAEEAVAVLAVETDATRRAEILVADGDPAVVIGRVAREQGVGAIVMGLHSWTSLGPRMGSVTYQVLCQTSMPVLALPPHLTSARQRLTAAAQAGLAHEMETRE